MTRSRNQYRARLEVLEDRTTPTVLGLGSLPSAAQAGLAIAASANVSSQAPNHSPVFEAPTTTGATPALANFTLPPPSATGIGTAAGNASSQALNLSPVFQL
jgi:hypothetical protein